MQYSIDSSYALQYYLALYWSIIPTNSKETVQWRSPQLLYLYNQNSDKQTEIDPPLEDDANDHFFLFGIQE